MKFQVFIFKLIHTTLTYNTRVSVNKIQRSHVAYLNTEKNLYDMINIIAKA